LLIFSTLLAAFPVTIEAASYSQLRNAQQSEKQTQNQLNTTALHIDKTEAQLLSLKTSVGTLTQSISTKQTEISGEQSTILGLKAQEANQEAARERLVQDFNGILVSTYENGGSMEYLSLLLNAANWDDFIWRLDAIETILKHNQDLQNNIIAQNKIINKQALAISQDMTTIQTSVSQDNQLVSLKQQTISNEQIVLSGLSKNQRQLEEAKLGQLNTISDIQRELLDQEREAEMAAKNGPVKSTPGIPNIARPVVVGSGGIASMINYAEGYIGTPYVWGGISPNPGFDCSGFTQYVFRHLGVNLQRTSQEQYCEGTSVSENNLEPGDLVFFTTYTYGASHVGIYIGNGLMVDSEASGVIIDNVSNAYWAPRYLGAKRIAQ
jgi:cell wall-associated NlpC family hydrolase